MAWFVLSVLNVTLKE